MSDAELRHDDLPPPADGWRLVRDSLTTLWILHSDGTTFTRYGYDWRHAKARGRRQLVGVTRLENMLMRWRKPWDKARIYDRESNTIIRQYVHGKRIL
jgi:hypothetical protein